MPFGGDSGGPKEPCIRWDPDPPREGPVWGIVRSIEKHCTLLLHTTKKSVTA